MEMEREAIFVHLCLQYSLHRRIIPLSVPTAPTVIIIIIIIIIVAIVILTTVIISNYNNGDSN